jgi:TonB family protein
MDTTHASKRGTGCAAFLETANDRFKRDCRACLWAGIIFATVIHFGVLVFFPPLGVADVGFGVVEFEALDLPPEVEIPPPPEQITRPAVPVVATTDLQEDVTIAPTTFEENPVDQLPPPPSEVARLSERPVLTPFTVAPHLKDREKAQRIVQSKYPKQLQDIGLGGVVLVWAFIDETGVVENSVVRQSSGIDLLDDAALEAVREFEFVPALLRDARVPVWISIPITFAVIDPRYGSRRRH